MSSKFSIPFMVKLPYKKEVYNRTEELKERIEPKKRKKSKVIV